MFRVKTYVYMESAASTSGTAHLQVGGEVVRHAGRAKAVAARDECNALSKRLQADLAHHVLRRQLRHRSVCAGVRPQQLPVSRAPVHVKTLSLSVHACKVMQNDSNVSQGLCTRPVLAWPERTLMHIDARRKSISMATCMIIACRTDANSLQQQLGLTSVTQRVSNGDTRGMPVQQKRTLCCRLR